ncbi:MAG: phosphotransferase enzyme family protein [Pseudomonadales bacterium]
MTDFYDLPLLKQEEQLLKLARTALDAWGLEGDLSLIKHRENAVYSLLTSNGKRFALRVHRANYHSDDALRAELEWINALREYGIGAPEVIPTRSGEFFTRASSDAIGDPRQVDLLAWVAGEQLGSIENGLGDAPDAIRDTYLTIGQLAGKVHNQSSQWQVPEGFIRHAWDTEGLVGENPFWGPFWELDALTSEQRELVNRAREEVRQGLLELGKSPDDYSLIHADFVPENFLVDGDEVQIIDFDDAGFGWHLFELATALYFIQPDKNYAIARAALIEGYRQQRSLSDEKLEKLPLFIAARSFTYLGWVHTRQSTETARELTPMLIEMCCNAAREYLAIR